MAPTRDSAQIIHADVHFPPYTVNPQLWLEPLAGMGIVAGRVLDAEGRPVAGARVYGLRLPQPEETPFSFAETYLERAHPDPAYGKHFAVGDVPEGTYVVGADVAGVRVFRRVEVRAGMLTFVELRPD